MTSINEKMSEIIGHILNKLNIDPELPCSQIKNRIEQLDAGLSNLYEDAVSDNKQDNLNALDGYNKFYA